MDGKRTRIDVVVDTTVYFGIQTIILGDGKHIGSSQIDAASETVVVAALEEILERIAQCDVVTLQERAVTNKVVGLDVIVGCPSVSESS